MFNVLGSTWGSFARLRAALYERDWLRGQRLERPVVSIGALSVGGAGKTPTTVAIAALLRDAGLRPAILSRGYRRDGSEPLLVSAGDGSGPRVDAAIAGDEPYWMASVLPDVAVAVAARREEAAALVTPTGDRDVFLLDDGYQHLRLRRDANLLVVNPEAPFWEDAPLPAGRLREAPAAARRADAFLVIGDDEATDRALEERHPDRPRFTLARRPVRCWPATQAPPPVARDGNDDGPGETPPSGPAYAFAGIARPSRFFRDAGNASIELAGSREFPDHHAYQPADLWQVADAAQQAGAQWLVTTEKDAVRLPETMPDLPVWVFGYRLAPTQPGHLRDWLRDQAGLR